VQEEQNQDPEDEMDHQMQPNHIPDGHSEDDESAATEVAEAIGADVVPN